MPNLDSVLTKCRAVARRGLPSLRNVVLSRFGVWPVGSLATHWLADLPIFCVSLERSNQRRRLISAQVKKMGLRRFEFLDAVDSKDLSAEELRASETYDSETCLRFHTRDLTLNEIACSLSHAEAYRRVVEHGHEWALIIEDDALFRTRRLARLQFESIPSGTDVVFLNAFLDRTTPRDPLAPQLYADTSYAGSSAAYLVSSSAAERLLEAALPVVHAADGLLGRVLSAPASGSHPFRQKGVSLTLTGVIVFPEAVTNGSTEHYHTSSIR